MSEDAGVSANSPYGAWLNLYFPIGKDARLRREYQLLDLNSLRMGKVLEVIDMLNYDSCHHYVRTMPKYRDIYFTSIGMGGV